MESLFLQPWVWASLRLRRAILKSILPSSSSHRTLSLLGLTIAHAGQLWGKVNPLPGALLPKAEQASVSCGGPWGSVRCYYREKVAQREEVLAV